MKYIVLLFILPLFGHSQATFKGKVIDGFSHQNIPYATIGLIKSNSGTNANEHGEFIINSRHPESDTLLISCVGYKTVRFPVSFLKKNTTIKLEVVEKQLRPIIIKNKWMYSDVGSYTVQKNHFYTSSGSQYQVAKKLTAPKEDTWLHAVNVEIGKEGRKCMFRVRIYDLDSVNKCPGDELTDTVVQVTSKGGLISIDFSLYNIQLPGKYFFVSIEWLFIPLNEDKGTTRYQGKKVSSISYKPYICFTKDLTASREDIWNLHYFGKWMPNFSSEERNLAISAIVKY